MRNSIVRLALVAGAAALATGPAQANHSWSGYHWARTTAGKLAVRVNVAVDSSWASYVDTAVKDWEVPVRDYDGLTGPDVLTVAYGNVTADRQKCNPISGQVLVCNYAYGKRGWLGIASIWTDGTTHIVQGTTKLNDSYFGSRGGYGAGHRALVACQEIGHDFGLAHQDEGFSNLNVGSCMDYTNNPDGGGTNGPKGNRKPNFHDYDQLAKDYAHADTYTTATTTATTNFGVRRVGQGAAQQTRGSGDTAAEWGTPIHRDSKGRPDTFIRSWAGGKVITHVLWSPDAKGTEAGPHADDGHTH